MEGAEKMVMEGLGNITASLVFLESLPVDGWEGAVNRNQLIEYMDSIGYETIKSHWSDILCRKLI